MNKFGEDISYSFSLVVADDLNNLQLFSCGNSQLDYHIHNDIIKNGQIIDEDGLYFKFVDDETDKIVAVTSVAASGIIYEVDLYTKLFPSFKIDVLAIDKEYQKLHYNEETKLEKEHFYFSDEILGDIICHCKHISEEYMEVSKNIPMYLDLRS